MQDNFLLPPRIKYWEAAGAVADGRVTVCSKNSLEIVAEVASSTGKKSYEVIWKKSSDEWSSNDNGTYWRRYFGYPILAVMASVGIMSFPDRTFSAFAGIQWKLLNEALGNNYSDVERALVREGVVTAAELDRWEESIDKQLRSLRPRLASRALRPPKDH